MSKSQAEYTRRHERTLACTRLHQGEFNMEGTKPEHPVAPAFLASLLRSWQLLAHPMLHSSTDCAFLSQSIASNTLLFPNQAGIVRCIHKARYSDFKAPDRNTMSDFRKRKSRWSSRSDEGLQSGAIAKMRRNGSRILSLVGWQRNSPQGQDDAVIANDTLSPSSSTPSVIGDVGLDISFRRHVL